ncbi:hypothetical protein ENTCAN_06675 [Enterobacter cancerogenus ATCC 35316]|nr:hypothetical protein ENTCAN_06675 [Enterobacter cancerogenus ATCC 35316]
MENDMTPLKEIGECVIGAGEREYFFRPSFRNMARIGEPDHVVRTFYALFNDDVAKMLQAAREIHSALSEHQRKFYAHYFGDVSLPRWALDAAGSAAFVREALLSAINVIQSCCDEDVSDLTGWHELSRTGKRTFVWHRGALPPENLILIAQSLIMHGVIGRAKVRKLQKHEGKETTPEFHATEYIMAARNHFGISREEAENLTMTEFAMMLNAKYPDQKGFTREEYDAVMDDDDRRWQEMIEREKNSLKT